MWLSSQPHVLKIVPLYVELFHDSGIEVYRWNDKIENRNIVQGLGNLKKIQLLRVLHRLNKFHEALSKNQIQKNITGIFALNKDFFVYFLYSNPGFYRFRFRERSR